MGNGFTLTKSIDWKPLERAMSEDEILIGWPSGKSHSGSGEALDEIARKLSFGAGPQTWTVTRNVDTGTLTKSGRKRRKKTTQTFHVNHIEARPILDDGIEAGESEINGKIAKYYEKKLSGENSNSLLNAIGVACVGVVQKFARMGGYADKPNSPEWSKFKEGAPPWIDTGELLNSLTFVTHEGKHEKVKGDDGKSEWKAT